LRFSRKRSVMDIDSGHYRKGEYLDAAQKTFISSTMWTERIARQRSCDDKKLDY
jgi:hypothetical protein